MQQANALQENLTIFSHSPFTKQSSTIYYDGAKHSKLFLETDIDAAYKIIFFIYRYCSVDLDNPAPWESNPTSPEHTKLKKCKTSQEMKVFIKPQPATFILFSSSSCFSLMFNRMK